MGGRRARSIRSVLPAALLLTTLAACALPALPPGTPTPIPTSSWSGGYGMSAALDGTLTRDADGCLVVQGVTVLWPRGYTAVQGDDGTVSVLDTYRRVVARTGAGVRLGGGGGVPGYSGPCLDGRDYFMVTGDVDPLEAG